MEGAKILLVILIASIVILSYSLNSESFAVKEGKGKIPLEYTISVSSPITVNYGKSVPGDVTVSHISGLGNVELSASNIPIGVVISFNPVSSKLSDTNPGFTSDMTIEATSLSQNGDYDVTITGTGKGGVVRNDDFRLIIENAPTDGGGDVIAVAGDIACRPPTGKGKIGKETGTTCHQRQTSDLLLAINPIAVLTTGDNQYEKGELQNYLDSYNPTWGQVKSKTYPTPGNHEYGTSDAAGYFQYFGARAGDPSEGYYSFDTDFWHIIALNSNCTQIGGCDVNSAQYQWLVNDLKENSKNCIMAYWHHPKFSSGIHGNDLRTLDFWEVLYQKGADLIITGHDHNYERFAKQNPNGVSDDNGIRQFVVGTGGKSLRTIDVLKPNSEVFNSNTFGVLKLVLNDGSYDWQFVPEGGKTFTDLGSNTCN
jgi:hypothetical protein